MSIPVVNNEIPEPVARPSGTNFPAGNDLTEPADKKTHTMISGKPNSGQRSSSDPGSGVLAHMANRFSTPFPHANTQTVQVKTADMVNYFGTIWDSLTTAIYPDSSFEPAGLITRDNFILVCRYLTKARIDHVFASTAGLRLSGCIDIPPEFQIPKCLADVINGIGTIFISSGAFMVIPQPESAPEDAACGLHNVVSHAMLCGFASLVKSAHVRDFIRVSTVSSVVEGTAWWLLTARDPTNTTIIANGLDRVFVAATFPEWKPVDGLLCAIVQRQFDGLFPNLLTGLTWTFDTVRGISGLRSNFNMDA